MIPPDMEKAAKAFKSIVDEDGDVLVDIAFIREYVGAISLSQQAGAQAGVFDLDGPEARAQIRVLAPLLQFYVAVINEHVPEEGKQ